MLFLLLACTPGPEKLYGTRSVRVFSACPGDSDLEIRVAETCSGCLALIQVGTQVVVLSAGQRTVLSVEDDVSSRCALSIQEAGAMQVQYDVILDPNSIESILIGETTAFEYTGIAQGHIRLAGDGSEPDCWRVQPFHWSSPQELSPPVVAEVAQDLRSLPLLLQNLATETCGPQVPESGYGRQYRLAVGQGEWSFDWQSPNLILEQP